MALLRSLGRRSPKLTRAQSLAAIPLMNPLITVEHNEQGSAVLSVPRKRTSIVKMLSKMFRLPPYRRIELDELGTYTIQLCDGSRTVKQVVARFAKKFGLNRREADVMMRAYLQGLAKRGVVIFGVPKDPAP